MGCQIRLWETLRTFLYVSISYFFFHIPNKLLKGKRGKDVNLWFPLNSKNENNHSPLSVIILHLPLQLKSTSSFLNLVVYSFSFCCLKQIDAVWVVASYQTEVVPSVTKKDQKANYFVFFFSLTKFSPSSHLSEESAVIIHLLSTFLLLGLASNKLLFHDDVYINILWSTSFSLFSRRKSRIQLMPRCRAWLFHLLLHPYSLLYIGLYITYSGPCWWSLWIVFLFVVFHFSSSPTFDFFLLSVPRFLSDCCCLCLGCSRGVFFLIRPIQRWGDAWKFRKFFLLPLYLCHFHSFSPLRFSFDSLSLSVCALENAAR